MAGRHGECNMTRCEIVRCTACKRECIRVGKLNREKFERLAAKVQAMLSAPSTDRTKRPN